MFVLIFAGSFSCQCHVGFRKMEAEGACSDVNECEEIAALCGHGDCQNLPGTYLCQCHFGFRLSDGTCAGCMIFPLCLLKTYLPMKFVISRIRFFDAAPILSAEHFFLARTYICPSAELT